MSDKARLAVAEEHVTEAERIFARQIQGIAKLKLHGVDTTEAEQTLALFEVSLEAFRRHRDSILKSLSRDA
jgi:hypothetical protein